MLALIAGRGALPAAVAGAAGEPVLICGLDHCPPDHVEAEHLFCIERLGGFLAWLRSKGVTRVCLCGSVDRPNPSLRRIGLRTLPLVPRILRALKRGDDGALRIAIDILEGAGFTVLAAHELAPSLLPAAGVPTRARPDDAATEAARLGDRVSGEQARRDLGQACVVREGRVIARETEAGTDAMLRGLGPEARGGVLYKAPKPGQERRADLPVIGLQTAEGAAAAGLAGIVVESQGVMVLDQPQVLARLEASGLFLWIRERGA
ncbi:UDP-2,3-diacylglucosamine diphosphatase LpxI [Mameliella alba]|nr:UDP-2,3-diacylglucosamine diphosphatase LpxI [Mameliella alba]MBY6169902.1 UDP-2,3-diacylglucosamine diphosphatase LpxI [Mameliella alba]MBY6175121.1 UDP-2,3-diacylglucosamine diphosphatase LpxI [Mameliella alba]